VDSEFFVKSVASGTCNAAVSAVSTIRVVTSGVAGTITGGGILCENDGAMVSISGAEGSIRWEYSTDGISYYDATYWRTFAGVNTTFVPNCLNNWTGLFS
jgi:hypothetical protein